MAQLEAATISWYRSAVQCHIIPALGKVELARRLGHSSISITLDTYSAVLPNMQREAVERLAQTMGGR